MTVINNWQVNVTLSSIVNIETGEVRRLGEYQLKLLLVLIDSPDTTVKCFDSYAEAIHAESVLISMLAYKPECLNKALITKFRFGKWNDVEYMKRIWAILDELGGRV